MLERITRVPNWSILICEKERKLYVQHLTIRSLKYPLLDRKSYSFIVTHGHYHPTNL